MGLEEKQTDPVGSHYLLHSTTKPSISNVATQKFLP